MTCTCTCTCGKQLASDDNYCPKCGAKRPESTGPRMAFRSFAEIGRLLWQRPSHLAALAKTREVLGVEKLRAENARLRAENESATNAARTARRETLRQVIDFFLRGESPDKIRDFCIVEAESAVLDVAGKTKPTVDRYKCSHTDGAGGTEPCHHGCNDDLYRAQPAPAEAKACKECHRPIGEYHAMGCSLTIGSAGVLESECEPAEKKAVDVEALPVVGSEVLVDVGYKSFRLDVVESRTDTDSCRKGPFFCAKTWAGHWHLEDEGKTWFRIAKNGGAR